MIIPIRNILVKIPNYTLISLIIVIICYLLSEKILHKHKKIFNYLHYLCFLLYLFVLYEVMFGISGGFTFNRPKHMPNFYPLINIFQIYSMGSLNMLKQICLNIIIMIPFGLLLPISFPPFRRLGKTMAVIVTISILIEILQYFVGRSADIDDVIMYILGGFLGYFLFKLFLQITLNIKKIFC